VLIVTRLDRLARSTRDLLNVLDAVAKAKAGFRSPGHMGGHDDTARPTNADCACWFGRSWRSWPLPAVNATDDRECDAPARLTRRAHSRGYYMLSEDLAETIRR
jgi:hypothetical protein